MNPFAALQVSDDDDDQQFTKASTNDPKQPRKTHQQRKQIKEAKIREAENPGSRPAVVTEEPLPERVKEDPRKKRYHEVVPPKEVPATGHYLDRRSGTGRVDKPRKEGAGKGNIGNIKDELNADKYIKEGETAADGATHPEQQKEPEPQGITLDEYYKNKGIDFENITAVKKEPVKKGEVNAEWIKKEKLTVLETKEDKKEKEEGKVSKKQSRRQYNEKVGLAQNLNSELFGFNAKPQGEREQRQPREQRQHRQPREPREQRQPRQNREQRQPREHKEPREPREQKEPRQPREQKEPREPRQNKGRGDNRDNRDQKGGQRGNNNDNRKGGAQQQRKPQEKVSLNDNDFPTL